MREIEEMALADGKTIARLAELAGITFKSRCTNVVARRGHLLAHAVKQGRVFEIRWDSCWSSWVDIYYRAEFLL